MGEEDINPLDTVTGGGKRGSVPVVRAGALELVLESLLRGMYLTLPRIRKYSAWDGGVQYAANLRSRVSKTKILQVWTTQGTTRKTCKHDYILWILSRSSESKCTTRAPLIVSDSDTSDELVEIGRAHV